MLSFNAQEKRRRSLMGSEYMGGGTLVTVADSRHGRREK